jgi:hypothetical protein
MLMLVVRPRLKQLMKTHKLFDKIDIQFLNPLTNDISFENIIIEIEKKISSQLFSEIDIIYVGEFDFLKDEHLTFKFMESAIYLTNSSHYESDIIYDITSALAQSLETKYIHLIYDNRRVFKELQQISNINMAPEDCFIDMFVGYLIEDRLLVKTRSPNLYNILEEIIKNESC